VKLTSTLLLLEAVLCGSAATAVSVYAAPFLVGFPLAISFSTASLAPLLTVAWASASVVAVVEYWRLAFSTATHRKYRPGPLFFIGVLGAVVGTIQFTKWWGSFEALLVIAPSIAAALHFLILQWYRSRPVNTVVPEPQVPNGTVANPRYDA
jgi:hypothetical protein